MAYRRLTKKLSQQSKISRPRRVQDGCICHGGSHRAACTVRLVTPKDDIGQETLDGIRILFGQYHRPSRTFLTLAIADLSATSEFAFGLATFSPQGEGI